MHINLSFFTPLFGSKLIQPTRSRFKTIYSFMHNITVLIRQKRILSKKLMHCRIQIEVHIMQNKKAVIARWKLNRHDAMKRGVLHEVERINKILKFYGESPAEKKRRW